ncbi:hypothetical protein KI387_010450, partial [Taxus chinensis]
MSGSKAKLDAMYVKSVKEIPYNVSVLEISQVILPSDLSAPAPSPNALNISAELEKVECKIFVQLITVTRVLKTYKDTITTGLTLFTLTDEAFTGPVMAKLNKLSSAQQVSLLEYHAMPVYSPTGRLKIASGPMSTLVDDPPVSQARTCSSNPHSNSFKGFSRLLHYCSIGAAGSLDFFTGAKEAVIPFERNSVRSNAMDSTQESSHSFSNALLLSTSDNGYYNNPYSHEYAKSWLFNQSIEKDTPVNRPFIDFLGVGANAEGEYKHRDSH